MENIALLGATGSIGENTLDVVRSYPDFFRINAISFNKNSTKAKKIIQEFSPSYVATGDEASAHALQKEFPNVAFGWGIQGLVEAATISEITTVLTAVSGSIGLMPTLEAIKSGKKIALANKETLVMGGQLVMEAVEENNTILLPVDSEHSAIFQCLAGQKKENIDHLLLTASGGSFRNLNREELKKVTLEQALSHPNWPMGQKITIDSATMANKGLEVIEAHWLFKMNYDKIKVIMHRESVVHSMVVLTDGAYLAQLGASDMREPIQYALSYPERYKIKKSKPFDLAEIGQLHFYKLDTMRFPMVKLAYEVGRAGQTYPTVYNAANETAVAAFLERKISFLEIESLVEQAVDQHKGFRIESVESLSEVDLETRKNVSQWIKG